MFLFGFEKVAVGSKLYLKAARKVGKEMGDGGSSALKRMANIFPYQRSHTLNDLAKSKTRLRHATIRSEVASKLVDDMKKTSGDKTQLASILKKWQEYNKRKFGVKAITKTPNVVPSTPGKVIKGGN